MNRNMSNLDRGLRTFVVTPILIVAAILLGAGSIAGIVLFVLAGVMLATSAVGFCPLYTLFHVTTRRHAPVVHSH
jgi:hypothetical protein